MGRVKSLAIISCYLAFAAAHNITLVVMAPFPDNETQGWNKGIALIPGALIAAREINNSTEILPDFNLQLVVADSGCSTTSKATISLLRDIYENKDHQVVGIVGPGCSAAALKVSNFTSRHQVSLIHVTPSATTPELEDPKRNTTYATISSALLYVECFVELMNHNKWKYVATLEDEARIYFKQTHSKFVKTLEGMSGIRLAHMGSMFIGKNRNNDIPLDDIRQERARVVLVFAGRNAAQKLMCHAYHENMTYPDYQWVFHDRTSDDLLTDVEPFWVNGKNISCSKTEMVAATNRVILNVFNVTQKNRTMTLPLFQKTYEEYNEEYHEEFERYKQENNETYNVSAEDVNEYANSYHDAVWAFAIALHNASKHGVNLTTYQHNRNGDTKIIAEHLSRVSFSGVSGPIVFQNQTRSVRTLIQIKQIFDGNATSIGSYDRSRREKIDIESDMAEFINDTYKEAKEVYLKIHKAVGACIILITVFLTALVAFVQFANIYWYHRSSIKATSPNLSHLIFSGCYLFSIFVILYSIIESLDEISVIGYSIVCNAMVWCLLFGYSLIFGTVFFKVWRVYRLFNHFRNASPGVLLSDNALVLFVCLILLVDLLICISWNSFDPLMMQSQSVPSSNPQQKVSKFHCDCEHWDYWIGTIAAFKGVIIIPLLVLTILNRRIKRRNFKHTRNTTILIYSTTLMVGIGIPLYFLLQGGNAYSGILILSAILLCTILLCCLTLFLPPIIQTLKKKKIARISTTVIFSNIHVIENRM